MASPPNTPPDHPGTATETHSLPPNSALDALPPLPPEQAPGGTLQFSGAELAEPGEAPVFLPGYEILGILGRGGMGIVFKARQLALNRIVALKMSRSGEMTDTKERERFRAEAEAVAQLRHPNIVQIYEVGEHKNRPFFSFEYVDGGSLADALNATPQPPLISAQIVETLSRAMHVAHAQGIVHRDLKPANVLLAGFRPPSPRSPKAPTASEGHAAFSIRGSARHLLPTIPKITDFGVAKRLDMQSLHTATGAVVGTPNYMAPEQAWGRDRSRPIGATADVYSLGAILYEMLTGRPPFLGETPLDTLQQVVSEEPVPPTRLQSKIPKDLETICLKCLQKEALRRYPTADQLGDDLRRFLEDRPIQAKPAGAMSRLLRWRRRNPAVAFLLVAVAAALLLGTGVSTYFAIESTIIADQLSEQIAKGEDLGILAARAKDDQKKAAELTKLLDKQKLEVESILAKAQLQAAINEKSQRRIDELLDQTNVGGHLRYLTMMTLANVFAQDRDPKRAAALVLDQVPAKTNGVDLRSFEWYYLRRLTESHEQSFRAHASSVRTVVLDPKGEVLATGNAARDAAGKSVPVEIALWNARTGEHLRAFKAHETSITSLAISPDGKLLASAAEDGVVKVWDLTNAGRQLFSFAVHTKAANCVDFSPDSKSLISCSADSTLRYYNCVTGVHEAEPLDRLPAAALWVRHHPDGGSVAVACADHCIYIYNTSRGRVLNKLDWHKRPVRHLAYDATGQYLATAGEDGGVGLWDLFNPNLQQPIKTFSGHQGPVYQVGFSPDGGVLASVSEDKTLQLRYLSTRADEKKAVSGSAVQRCLAWSPLGSRLFVGGDDGFVAVWQLGRKDNAQVWTAHNAEIHAVTWNGDGTLVATCRGSPNDQALGGEVIVWNAATGSARHKWTGHAKRVMAAAFQPQGKWFATASMDGSVRLWDVETGKEVKRLVEGTAEYSQVAWSPDGKRLAAICDVAESGKFHSRITIWDLEGRKELTFADPIYSVEALAWSQDGKWLAAGSTCLDRDLLDVRLWDAATGQLVHTFPGHTHPVLSVAFSDDSRLLAASSKDGSVRIWDVKTKMERKLFRGDPDGVRSVRFHPDGRRLVTAEGKLVKIWDLATTQEVIQLPGHAKEVTGVAFRPDGFQLASISKDGTVRLWDGTPLPGEGPSRWKRVR